MNFDDVDILFYTLGTIRGGNGYAYCGNDPIQYYDPYGYERIVVSGSEYGAPRYKYNFIEPAIKKLSEKGNFTWIISKTGYSNKDIEKFRSVAKKINVKLVLIDNANELYNYINSKSITSNKLSSTRKIDLISEFTLFSHGLPGVVSLGYNQGNKTKSLEMTTSGLQSKMDKKAFASFQYSTFYSCNAGTYPKTPYNSFAQAWANVAGGTTKAAYGTTYYGDINKNQSLINRARWKIDGFYRNGSKNYPVLSSGVKWGYFYRNPSF